MPIANPSDKLHSPPNKVQSQLLGHILVHGAGVLDAAADLQNPEHPRHPLKAPELVVQLGAPLDDCPQHGLQHHDG